MSLLKSLTKKSRLNAAIKTVSQARKSEGGKADQLFIKAYQEFWDVIADDLILGETLYNWGFALLQEGKKKTDDAAIKIFEEAINKFSFCLTIEPHFLGAAIDGGVTMMELARIKAAPLTDPLYQSAKAQFDLAEKIQKGSAIYNLACINALMGEDEACLKALQEAVEYGSLPNQTEVLNDPDLEKVKSKTWFLEFIETVKIPVKAEAPAKTAETAEIKESAATVEESSGNHAADNQETTEANESESKQQETGEA